jgi:hypothetical protein
VFPVFTGYTDKQTMLRVIVSAPIAALACGFLCAFLLASLKKHLQARAEKTVSAAPKFTREQIKALPPTEIIEVLIKLRYIKAQHRPALLKMLDEGNTKIWNLFDVFFSSTKGTIWLWPLCTPSVHTFVYRKILKHSLSLQRWKLAASYF